MSNVETITGEPFTQLGEPDSEVINALKRFLSMAEAGLIRQIHIIGITHDGSVERTAKGHRGNIIMLAGATAWAEHRLCAFVDHRDITPPPQKTG